MTTAITKTAATAPDPNGWLDRVGRKRFLRALAIHRRPELQFDDSALQNQIVVERTNVINSISSSGRLRPHYWPVAIRVGHKTGHFPDMNDFFEWAEAPADWDGLWTRAIAPGLRGSEDDPI